MSLGYPKDHWDRHNPLHPIVPDAAIMTQYPVLNHDDNHYTTYYETDSAYPQNRSPGELLSDSDDLTSDMANLTQYVGDTVLAVVPWDYADHPSGEYPVKVRVQRRMALRYEGGKYIWLPAQTYETTIDELEESDVLPPD